MTVSRPVQSFSSTVRGPHWRMRAVLALTTVAMLTAATGVQAGPVRDRMEERMHERMQERRAARANAQPTEQVNDSTHNARAASRSGQLPPLPPGASVLRNQPYGTTPEQVMDVYLPLKDAPVAGVLFMVHGGGWRMGDKQHSNVIQHKLSRWLPRHMAFISVNYRLLPGAPVSTQAEDIRHALAHAQAQAAQWGLPADRFVLMGHSAGAHLVALVSAKPQPALAMGAHPWLGTVVLDSAVMNVPAYMGHRHAKLYDDAFGADPAYWMQNSPWHQMSAGMPPMMLACSTQRADKPCEQAQGFATKAHSLAKRTEVLPQPKSHSEMNDDLGLPGAYTNTVERFMASLHPALAQALR